MTGSGTVLGKQENFGGTEAGEEEEGVCRTADGHLSSTWSYIPDLSTYVERGPEVEADGATEEGFYDALDTNTDASVA